MAAITVRGLDPAVKQAIRVRAAEHGRSMEAEAREILGNAVGATESSTPRGGLGTTLRNDFATLREEYPELIDSVFADLRVNDRPRAVDFSGPEFGSYDDDPS